MERSMMICALASTAALIWAAVVAAQTTVYKCQTADGVMFSGQPCAKSAAAAKHMQVLHLRRGPPPDPAAMERLHDAQLAMDESIRQDKLDEQERICYANMTGGTFASAAAQVADDRQDIANLQYNLRYAANNMAGATWENGIKRQIAALRASIDTQQQIRSRADATARTVCANDRRAADKATRPPAAAAAASDNP